MPKRNVMQSPRERLEARRAGIVSSRRGWADTGTTEKEEEGKGWQEERVETHSV